jgi:hypothetical protein
MKKAKGVIFCIIFLIAISSLRVGAVVGVSPGIYEVDFEPGLKEQFVFDFIFDEGVESEVYIEGDLSQYFEVDKEFLVGEGIVVSKMDLPDSIDTPGPHRVFIGARQTTSAPGGGIGLAGDVRGVILVDIPYPGKYAQIDIFEVTNANQGEPINISLKVLNQGKENINAYAAAEVYDEDNELVDRIYLGSSFIETTKSYTFNKVSDTFSYKPGDYKIKAIINYEGGILESERTFRLGTLELKISDYTKEFEMDKINPFIIEVESFWNNKIDSAYVDVQIIGYNISFLTPSAEVDRWSKVNFTGFLDTTGIKEKKFKANIVAHYADKTTSQTVNLKIKSEINYGLYALIGGGIFLAILFISIIIAMIILFMKVRKNEEPSHKRRHR